MDPVLSYASAAHYYGVSWLGLFFVTWPVTYLFGHHSACPAKDQGFSQVALIKENGAVNRGDAALVAAMLHTFPYALKDAFWMK